MPIHDVNFELEHEVSSRVQNDCSY